MQTKISLLWMNLLIQWTNISSSSLLQWKLHSIKIMKIPKISFPQYSPKSINSTCGHTVVRRQDRYGARCKPVITFPFPCNILMNQDIFCSENGIRPSFRHVRSVYFYKKSKWIKKWAPLSHVKATKMKQKGFLNKWNQQSDQASST